MRRRQPSCYLMAFPTRSWRQTLFASRSTVAWTKVLRFCFGAAMAFRDRTNRLFDSPLKSRHSPLFNHHAFHKEGEPGEQAIGGYAAVNPPSIM